MKISTTLEDTSKALVLDVGTECFNCRSTDFKWLFQGYGFDHPDEVYHIVECPSCGLAKTYPSMSAEGLLLHYTSPYYGRVNRKFNFLLETLVRWTNNRRAKFLISKLPITHRPENTRVLDIGCGRGNFLKALRRKNYDCFGTEIPGFVLPDETDIKLFRGPVESHEFEDGYFHAVSIWHVLEHTLDPGKTIKCISRILAPGGVAVVALPNFSSWQRRLFNENWFHLDLPRHTNHFAERTLLNALRAEGLEPICTQTQTIDQNLLGFVQSALNAIMPLRSSNHFYSLLKTKQSRSRAKTLVGLICYLPILSVLFPLALVEELFSHLFGNAATTVVYARKITKTDA